MPKLTERQIVSADAKVKQFHDYARHIFQTLVAWFTFFITVNYASMGWLAKPSADSHAQHSLVSLVALVFALHNVLGIWVTLVARKQMITIGATILTLDRLTEDGSASPPIPELQCNAVPITLYSVGPLLMVTAMAPLFVAWCVLPFLFGRT
ncbi:MAG TPA: hypothetical protein VGM37_01350 [Armatimonadota bacterium]